MIKNIKKGWKTTVIGLLVLLASLASVFLKDMSWLNASVGMLMGLGLLFTPDTVIGSIGKFLNKLFGTTPNP